MKTCILGVGNELRRDDGVGPAVIGSLKLKNWSEDTTLVPVGSDLFSICGYIRDFSKIVIIDALLPNREPGKIHIIDWKNLITDNKSALSLHDLDLITLLKWIKLHSKASITLLGIEVYDISWQIGLSPELSHKFDDIVDEVYSFISNERV